MKPIFNYTGTTAFGVFVVAERTDKYRTEEQERALAVQDARWKERDIEGSMIINRILGYKIWAFLFVVSRKIFFSGGQLGEGD